LLVRQHAADIESVRKATLAESDAAFMAQAADYLRSLKTLGSEVMPVWVRQVETGRSQMESAIIELNGAVLRHRGQAGCGIESVGKRLPMAWTAGW